MGAPFCCRVFCTKVCGTTCNVDAPKTRTMCQKIHKGHPKASPRDPPDPTTIIKKRTLVQTCAPRASRDVSGNARTDTMEPWALQNEYPPLLCVFYECLTFFCFSGGDFEGNRILLNPGSTNCVSRHTFLSIYMVSGPGESGGSTPPPRGLLNVAPCHFYQRKGPRNCLRFRATSLSDVVLVRSDMYVRSAN